MQTLIDRYLKAALPIQQEKTKFICKIRTGNWDNRRGRSPLILTDSNGVEMVLWCCNEDNYDKNFSMCENCYCHYSQLLYDSTIWMPIRPCLEKEIHYHDSQLDYDLWIQRGSPVVWTADGKHCDLTQ
jgi:hypothetical protein